MLERKWGKENLNRKVMLEVFKSFVIYLFIVFDVCRLGWKRLGWIELLEFNDVEMIVVMRFFGFLIYWCCLGRGFILWRIGMGDLVLSLFMWMNCFSWILLFRIRLLCFLLRDMYVVWDEFEILI